MIKRIAWRMQANVEGALSERARRRAMELADDADIRKMPPRERAASPGAQQRTATVPTVVRPSTDLLPGTVLQRQYKGRSIQVTVLRDGFEFEGERFKSLTAVAKSVTGKYSSGFHFFGLRRQEGAGRRREAEGRRETRGRRPE